VIEGKPDHFNWRWTASTACHLLAEKIAVFSLFGKKTWLKEFERRDKTTGEEPW